MCSFLLFSYLQDLNGCFGAAMPVVPYNTTIVPVIAVYSTTVLRSLVKENVMLHGRTCDLIRKD